MAHYKKSPWYEIIDPSFSGVIRIALERLKVVHIPSNEGHLILQLNEKQLEKIGKEGFPKICKLYEEEDATGVVENSRFLCFEVGEREYRRLVKEYKKNYSLFSALVDLASQVSDEKSRLYYQSSFAPLESVQHFKKHTETMSEKELKNWKIKINCDKVSLLWHVLTSGFDALRKDDKMMGQFLEQHSSDSKMLRRGLFSIWTTLCIINHKKTLKQLFQDARNGDDEALYKLLQLDKTLFDHEWVRVRMRKALYAGEMEFIHKVGEHLRMGHFETNKENLEITYALMVFWNAGICRLTDRQKSELLKDSGIRFTQDDRAFRQIVRRIKPFLNK